MARSFRPFRSPSGPARKVGLGARTNWVTAGLLTLLLAWIFRINPYFCEVVYSRGIYLLLRLGWDYTAGWLPLPWLYPLAAGLLGWGGWRIWHIRRRGLRRRGWRLVGRIFLNLLALVAGVVTIFYLAWGYNYFRRPVTEQLHIPPVQATGEGLEAEFQRATTELLAAHAALGPRDSVALGPEDLPPRLESHLRALLTDTLAALQYPTAGRVRVRRIHPPGLLMQLGASGIYLPFVGEGHYDAALPPCLWPEVMAHEMAHGYGFGDEGTCNFWAWLACSSSPYPAVRYSACLSYWIEVARSYRRHHPDAYAARRAQLSPGIRADFAAINAAYQRYPGFFPQFYDRVYDGYLKQQGISEGIRSYAKVVQLRLGWEQVSGKKINGAER